MRTWVKLYTEILRDPKLAAMPDHRFRVCINLIALAGQLDKDGLLGTTDEIAFHLRLDPADASAELEELASVRVTVCKKGVWSLKNWNERNGKVASDKPESRRERVQKWRENKAKADEVKRQGNADVTPLHRERNGSREEERREEKNKPSAGQNQPAPPEPSEPDPVKELAAVFEQAAGVKLPVPSGEKAKKTVGVTWWHPLREMVKLANGNSEQLLRTAVKQLRAKNLNVSSPQSCLKTFVSLHGAAVTGAGASLAAQYRAAGYTDANGNPV